MTGFGSWPQFGSRLPVPTAKTWVDGGAFHWEMVMPMATKLHPEYDKMIHDAALSAAHEAGLVPVGEILISDEPVDGSPGGALREGESLDAYMLRRRVEDPLGTGGPARMKVHAEVLLASDDLRVRGAEELTEALGEHTDLDEELKRLLGGEGA